MFDDFAKSLFADFPEFDGFSRERAIRSLSRAYLAIIEYRVNRSTADLEELAENQPFLRRLANTLFFHVVINEERGQQERRAAAFVAAESISLMADYIAIAKSFADNVEQPSLRVSERYTRIEAALLYQFARYDACASSVLSMSPPTIGAGNSLEDRTAAWCFERIEGLCRLRLTPTQNTGINFNFRSGDTISARPLEIDTISRLYFEIGMAAIDFTEWLGGNTASLPEAVTRLDGVIAALTVADDESPPVGHEYGRIHHLATLLKLCLPSLEDRALLHVVPNPPGFNPTSYRKYLYNRAMGTAASAGRPVLWPSALQYVRDCVVGSSRHAVVSMPTGSGKSFVGELAVSQAVGEGWALYLAPTNALTEQIRRDLREGLKELGTDVLAFIGDQEYSIFATDRVEQMQNNSVAVMTPEKCALALRLSPDAFANCRLVVFDECHLIGDPGSTRGPVAELVVTQLMLQAPHSRFVLMSAIIQNPEDLSGWLESATGDNAKAVTIKWRPTRTLRSILGVENEAFQCNADAARKALSKLTDNRKSLTFRSPCALAANLYGAWQSESEPDYVVSKIDCNATLSAKRRKTVLKEWHYTYEADSWVNVTAAALATKFAERGIQTLVFTPANRHYPFSNGNKVKLSQETLERLPDPPDIVETCRVLAEYELGCDSLVYEMLDRGVAVHTSLMLETEKIGSELMFRQHGAPIMFATGTLAQGLNLPAIAVIIAGSRIGDPRGEETDIVERRKFSQLLNAAGRAGRAGFANQGLVIAIPDIPIVFSDFQKVLDVRRQMDYLQQSDDAVPVESGLADFLDSVCAHTLTSDSASILELQVLSLLTGGDATQLDPHAVLKRTYASYLRSKAAKPQVTSNDAKRLVGVSAKFVEDTNAPAWLTIAAQRAGLDFFLTLSISQAWARVRTELPTECQGWTVQQWLHELLQLVAYIPPGLLSRQLPVSNLKHVSSEFKNLADTQDPILFQTLMSWKPPKKWFDAWKSVETPLAAWMNGLSTAEIASIVTDEDLVDITKDRTAGKPIPKALAIATDSWSRLSLVAGGLLSIAEQILDGKVPIALGCLPMCIKYGCNSPGTLAWFRFGVRLRRPSRLLSDAFPPPALTSDDELKEWVRDQRGKWLKGELTPAGDDEVFDAIRRFITN